MGKKSREKLAAAKSPETPKEPFFDSFEVRFCLVIMALALLTALALTLIYPPNLGVPVLNSTHYHYTMLGITI